MEEKREGWSATNVSEGAINKFPCEPSPNANALIYYCMYSTRVQYYVEPFIIIADPNR